MIGPETGKVALAASSNVKSRAEMIGVFPPVSAISTTDCPFGPTSNVSRSLGYACVKVLNVTSTSVTGPVIPETLISDGYGSPWPEALFVGIEMGSSFGNVSAWAAGPRKDSETSTARPPAAGPLRMRARIRPPNPSCGDSIWNRLRAVDRPTR